MKIMQIEATGQKKIEIHTANIRHFGMILILKLLSVAFKRRHVKPPTLHLARQTLVAAVVAHTEFLFATRVHPSCVVDRFTNVAHKAAVCPVTFIATQLVADFTCSFFTYCRHG